METHSNKAPIKIAVIGLFMLLGLRKEGRLLKEAVPSCFDDLTYQQSNVTFDFEISTSAATTNVETVESNGTALKFLPKIVHPRSWETIQTKRKLNFFHIPKAGGSSIVMAALAHNISWGDCLFDSPFTASNCPGNDREKWPEHEHGAPWWHIPIQYLHKDRKNPYADSDIFVVVRNPYERAVSEYYYHCKFKKQKCFGKNSVHDTPERLNRELQKALQYVLFAKKNSREYYQHWAHWIPQYDYIYHENKRSVHHILHNEYMEDEFQELVRAYQINVTLPKERKKTRQDLGAKCTALDLNVITMKLIEIVFEKDFEIGGYEMLSDKKAKLMVNPPVMATE